MCQGDAPSDRNPPNQAKDSTCGAEACTKCWAWKRRRLPCLQWPTFIDMKDRSPTFAEEVEGDLDRFNPATETQSDWQGFTPQEVAEVSEEGFELSTMVRVASENDVKHLPKKGLKSLTGVRLPTSSGEGEGVTCLVTSPPRPNCLRWRVGGPIFRKRRRGGHRVTLTPGLSSVGLPFARSFAVVRPICVGACLAPLPAHMSGQRGLARLPLGVWGHTCLGRCPMHTLVTLGTWWEEGAPRPTPLMRCAHTRTHTHTEASWSTSSKMTIAASMASAR